MFLCMAGWLWKTIGIIFDQFWNELEDVFVY